ncbi:MAG: cupin domain-containing protein [Pseudomonadota bacterium]
MIGDDNTPASSSAEADIDELVHLLSQAQADTPDPELEAAPSRRMKRNIMARVRAAEPAGTRTIHAATDGDAEAWEFFLDGVQRRVLLQDDGAGVQTVLYLLEPGAGFPAHEHTHLEECMVLQGDILVGEYPVSAGAMHIAEPGFVHDKIVARTQAMLLIRSQIYD